jgi:hypothetical protein
MDKKLVSMREFEVVKNTAFAAIHRDGFDIGRNAGLNEGRQ